MHSHYIRPAPRQRSRGRVAAKRPNPPQQLPARRLLKRYGSWLLLFISAELRVKVIKLDERVLTMAYAAEPGVQVGPQKAGARISFHFPARTL